MAKLLSYQPPLRLPIALDHLHQMSKSWLAEIDFWETEAIIFYKMINKHYIRAAKKKKLDDLNHLVEQIYRLINTDLKEIRTEIIEHEKQLAGLLSNPLDTDEQAYRDAHWKLQAQLNEVIAKDRALKKEVYQTLEKLI